MADILSGVGSVASQVARITLRSLCHRHYRPPPRDARLQPARRITKWRADLSACSHVHVCGVRDANVFERQG